MDIGKPQRIIEVVPASLPVPTTIPADPAPVPDPMQEPVSPAGG